LERARGYSLLWQKAKPDGLARIEAARIAYLNGIGSVWPIDAATALVAGEIMAMIPAPPTPPRRSHRLAESSQDRLARWRFDALIAATALVAGMPLVHNNAADFEAIRGGIECAPARFPRVGSLELIRCTALAVVS
jgi:predicted nucleic acid-binding protein